MIVVDDHLALLAIVGRLPELGAVEGAVATTFTFHFRLARALAAERSSGALARRVANPDHALQRVLHPPADRLVVLDPRASIRDSVTMAVRHGANLLFAELLGAAIHHGAAIRVTAANQGRTWAQVLAAERIDFATVAP